MNGWLKQGKKTINKSNSARFPAPPFQQQQQPFPGLAGKMQPRPDHGEDSYQGSGRLNGRKVLITGGDSGIGRAVAIAYAREGADVAINYLPEEEDDAREVVDLIKKQAEMFWPSPEISVMRLLRSSGNTGGKRTGRVGYPRQ